tara:strand:+ start:767 stop:1288 length:522 start_codon:yes stop_codon:yes gene_type:complete
MSSNRLAVTQIPLAQRVAWARAEWESGTNMTAVAKKHNVSRATLYRAKEDQAWIRQDRIKADALYERAKEVLEARETEAMEELESHVESVITRQRGLANELYGMVKDAFDRVQAQPEAETFKQAMSVKICSELLRNLVNENSKIYGLAPPKSKASIGNKQPKLSELLDELDND